LLFHLGDQDTAAWLPELEKEKLTDRALPPSSQVCRIPRTAGQGSLYNTGVHMRMKSVLLGLAAAGAIVLSAGATTLPASAAPVSSLKVSSSTLGTRASSTPASSLVPDTVGAVQCTGDLCIQRTTSIINNKATVKAWADTTSFFGHFELSGPDGHIANCPSNSNEQWNAGGTGCNFTNVAQGGGYTITAWKVSGKSVVNIGKVSFRV
jgi:hypothetical protein